MGCFHILNISCWWSNAFTVQHNEA